jgi:hypothetical protein
MSGFWIGDWEGHAQHTWNTSESSDSSSEVPDSLLESVSPSEAELISESEVELSLRFCEVSCPKGRQWKWWVLPTRLTQSCLPESTLLDEWRYPLETVIWAGWDRARLGALLGDLRISLFTFIVFCRSLRVSMISLTWWPLGALVNNGVRRPFPNQKMVFY